MAAAAASTVIIGSITSYSTSIHSVESRDGSRVATRRKELRAAETDSRALRSRGWRGPCSRPGHRRSSRSTCRLPSRRTAGETPAKPVAMIVAHRAQIGGVGKGAILGLPRQIRASDAYSTSGQHCCGAFPERETASPGLAEVPPRRPPGMELPRVLNWATSLPEPLRRSLEADQPTWQKSVHRRAVNAVAGLWRFLEGSCWVGPGRGGRRRQPRQLVRPRLLGLQSDMAKWKLGGVAHVHVGPAGQADQRMQEWQRPLGRRRSSIVILQEVHRLEARQPVLTVFPGTLRLRWSAHRVGP